MMQKRKSQNMTEQQFG